MGEGASVFMSRERWFVWRRSAYPSPRRAIKIGPLRMLRWDSDEPEWFIRWGRLHLIQVGLGRWEVLFWDTSRI